MVKKLLVILSLVLLVSMPALAANRWVGVYAAQGSNPDGTKYQAAVEVAQIPETQLYQIIWVLADGTVMAAVGFEQDGRLVFTGTNATLFGSVKSNGDSRWLTPGATAPLVETWKKTKYDHIEIPKRQAPAVGTQARSGQ